MTNIQLYQIFYLPEQRELLDPAFIPYDNIENKCPEWCEYHIFRKEYFRQSHQQADYTGYVSWKFGEKTGIAGAEFLNFITENPGYDVYYINPFQDERILVESVWVQGEPWHPGIISFAQKLFSTVYPQFGLDTETMLNPSEEFAFCNYWVANAAFWEKFIAFCEPAYDYMENHATPEELAFLDNTDHGNYKLSYRPYIMERLFSTLLWLNRNQKTESFRALFYDLKAPVLATPLALAGNRIKQITTPGALAAPLAADAYAHFRAFEAEHAAEKKETAALNEALTEAIAAAQTSLTQQREEFDRQQDAVAAQRDALHIERDEAMQHRDYLLNEREEIIAHRDALQSHRNELQNHRDELQTGHERLIREHRELAMERDQLVIEKGILDEAYQQLLLERQLLSFRIAARLHRFLRDHNWLWKLLKPIRLLISLK